MPSGKDPLELQSTEANNAANPSLAHSLQPTAYSLPASAVGVASRDALVEECAAALVQAFADYNAEFRAITRRAPQRFEVARLARQPARRGRAHRALRQVRQSRRRADAREARRGRDRARAVEQHQAPLHRADRGAARPRIRQDLLQLGHAPHVRHGRRRRRRRVRRARSRPASARSRRTIETNVYVNRGSLELLFEEVLADFRFRTPYRRFRPQRAHHHQRSARADAKPTPTPSKPPLRGRADRVHPHGVLPDDARLPGRAHLRPRLDAAVRARAEEHRKRRAHRCGDDGREPLSAFSSASRARISTPISRTSARRSCS